MSKNVKKQKEMTAMQRNILLIGAGVAFVVVLTAVILLALKFDLFGFQNGQTPATTAPVEKPSVVTPDDSETPEDSKTPENPDTPKQPANPDENDFVVSVDPEDSTETESGGGNQSISFDDLMAAAGMDKEKE